MDLQRDIETVLVGGGLSFRGDFFAGVPALVCTTAAGHRKVILPLKIEAKTLAEAAVQQARTLAALEEIKTGRNGEEIADPNPVIITEDRWFANRETMAQRLLAHLGQFRSIFARNCTIEKISRTDAAAFLEDNHSYGDAKSRYHYGIRYKDELVGAAEFSNARKWRKSVVEESPECTGKAPEAARLSRSGTSVKGQSDSRTEELVIRSYEWVRYASLPGTRIIGGMGKVLKHFIDEQHPDDIMSYADLEWSDGAVYQALGFEAEGQRKPVAFIIGTDNKRHPIDTDDKGRPIGTAPHLHEELTAAGQPANSPDDRYFLNFGSMKYRLKLTDYK